jgi:hypothetical protein
MSERKYRVAMMFAGDPSTRATVKLEETRLSNIAKALREVGLDVEAASYADEVADEVREQLLRVDGVLVWVDPVRKDGNRAKLDPILRDVASHGVFVSSHPDLILKMGTKEVLYRTRNMSWGSDTRLYTTLEQFRRELPQCLAEGKPRVLKQNRGNGGIGVWKVEAVDPRAPEARVRVRHALRGSQESEESLDEFVARCAQYFEVDGRIIDQVYQPRLTDGIVRCYQVRDRLAGFGEQLINALYPAAPGAAPADAPHPGPRLYYPPTRPDFQKLKTGSRVSGCPRCVACCRSTPQSSGHLGCGLHVRAEGRGRRRYLRALRDQHQLGLSVSGRGAHAARRGNIAAFARPSVVAVSSPVLCGGVSGTASTDSLRDAMSDDEACRRIPPRSARW